MLCERMDSRLTVEHGDDVAVARFTGPLVLSGRRAEAVGEELSRLADGLGGRRLVLNLAHVECLTTPVIGKLLKVQGRARAGGGGLALCGMSPVVQAIFEATGLAALVPTYPEEREALQGGVAGPGVAGAGCHAPAARGRQGLAVG